MNILQRLIKTLQEYFGVKTMPLKSPDPVKKHAPVVGRLLTSNFFDGVELQNIEFKSSLPATGRLAEGLFRAG